MATKAQIAQAHRVLNVRYKNKASFNDPNNTAKRRSALALLRSAGVHRTVPSNVIGGKKGKGVVYKNGKKYRMVKKKNGKRVKVKARYSKSGKRIIRSRIVMRNGKRVRINTVRGGGRRVASRYSKSGKRIIRSRTVIRNGKKVTIHTVRKGSGSKKGSVSTKPKKVANVTVKKYASDITPLNGSKATGTMTGSITGDLYKVPGYGTSTSSAQPTINTYKTDQATNLLPDGGLGAPSSWTSYAPQTMENEEDDEGLPPPGKKIYSSPASRSTVNSQATYNLGEGTTYHAATGKALPKTAKPVPRMIKKYTRSVKKNGKTVRYYKMVKNPAYKAPVAHDKLKRDAVVPRGSGHAGHTIKGYNNKVTIKSNGKTVSYKRSQYLWEAKNYGPDYVKKKYGSSAWAKEKAAVEHQTSIQGRSGAEASSNGKKVTVRVGNHYEQREIGNSQLNAMRNLREGSNFNYNKPHTAFREGGVAAPAEPAKPAAPTFQRQMNFNLENESNLAQGSHHEWAQATSISSLINGQLRQAQNAGADYWDSWAANRPGTTTLKPRESSQFGVDPEYNAGGQMGVTLGSDGVVRYATSNPMGAFGTNSVMQNEEEVSTTATKAPTTGVKLPDANAPVGTGAPNVNPTSPDGVYNPWHRGEGGETNSYGPNPAHLGRAAMESMALANAYFAPQRLELARELGDMETDMRRLAVNLGRQTDDPVLQAKLYKDAMHATRTLDIQQNTFAFQMSEQRRKEELANFQFYDQLAQEEYRLRLANAQFYEKLDLDKRAFNLTRWQVENAPGYNQGGAQGSTPAPSAGAPQSTGAAAKAPATQQSEIDNIYGNLTGGYNPYS